MHVYLGLRSFCHFYHYTHVDLYYSSSYRIHVFDLPTQKCTVYELEQCLFEYYNCSVGTYIYLILL